jgi:biopolymer transport protein ExbD
MSVRRPPSDEAKANLTPMIDMTFLLVVFFMLTIDLSKKEFEDVALPFAKNAVEDIEDPTQPKRLIINLLKSGDIVFKGQTWRLATGTPQEQAQALVALKAALVKLTAQVGTREDDGSSKIPVMIHGDRSARWEYVQWIMQVCADPRVQVFKIQFAVKGPLPESQKPV